MNSPIINPQFKSEEDWEDAINKSLDESEVEIDTDTTTTDGPTSDDVVETETNSDTEEEFLVGDDNTDDYADSDIDESIEPGYLNYISNLTNGSGKECIDFMIKNGIDIKHLNLEDENDKFIYHWLSGLKSFNQTAQSNLCKTGIRKCIEKGTKYVPGSKHTEDKFTNKLKKKPNSDGPIELTGNDAILNTIAKTQGLLKLNLFNSGFHVVIKKFSNDELNTFFNMVDEERKELGHYIGAHYYLIDDVFMKQKFIELFCKYAVVDSNLKNWSKKKTLMKSINIQDYDTLVWGQSRLMFVDGVDIDLHCTNEDCKHIERIKIDLSKLRINNFELLSEDMINQVVSSNPVTADAVKNYQNNPCFTDLFSLKDGTKLHVNPPTLEAHISTGERVISKIISAVNTDDENSTTIINNQYNLNMYKILAPWVNQADSYDGDTLEWITKSKDAIVTMMETDHSNDRGKLYKTFLQFFFDTKVSHFCYSPIKCPECGKEAPTRLKDFTPFDVQQLFFFLSAHRIQLAQMG